MKRDVVIALVFCEVDRIWKIFCSRSGFVLVEEYDPAYWEAQNTEEAIVKAFSAEGRAAPRGPADSTPSQTWIRDDSGVREISQEERRRIWGQLNPGVLVQSYPFAVVRFDVSADLRHVRLGFTTGSLSRRGAKYVVIGEDGEARLELDPQLELWMS
jgi:hypothetical protein